ncbi:MAG: cytochrome P450 [Gammaproteobacteria bacterium]
MRPTRPEIDFDHNSPAFAADPHAHLHRARETCPLAWSGHNGGYWVATGYEAMTEIARDDARFSSQRERPGDGNALAIPSMPSIEQIPIELDPPAFHVYRNMLNPILSPAAIDKRKPHIARWVTWCIDRFIERGECDLVLDFASPVPALSTMEWMGLPLDQWERFAGPLHAVVSEKPGTAAYDQAFVDLLWLNDQLLATARARRAEPRDDVVSWIVTRTVDGRPVNDVEAVSILSLFLVGGVDTTTSLTGQTLAWLAAHPAVRQRLIADPGLIANATEEFLRYFTPVTGLARRVTGDTVACGQALKRGERIWIGWAGANRDPAFFNRPDELDIDRFPNRHATFGLGAHRCAGSTFARAMFHEMLGQILARLPDYTVDASRTTHYPSQGVNTGLSRLAARFTPGPRIGPDTGTTPAACG